MSRAKIYTKRSMTTTSAPKDGRAASQRVGRWREGCFASNGLWRVGSEISLEEEAASQRVGLRRGGCSAMNASQRMAAGG
jgi:hypothetical protein